jgi:hypothetical protein
MKRMIFSIYQIHAATLGHGPFLASNTHEYQKQKKSFFWRVERGRSVRLTLPSMNHLPRQCGILNISQSNSPSRPITGIALLFYVIMFVPHRKQVCRPPRPVKGIPLPFYAYMMFVPHRKHLWASPACYGDGFTFQFVDGIRTSQKTRL